MKQQAHGRLRLLLLVLSTIAIQLVVAVLLKELADARGGDSAWWLLLVIGAAVGLNALRFLVWGYTHRHYPLSHSYPLTALFFPCILLISAWYGDPATAAEVGGVLVIMAGVALMNWEEAADA